jgi:hypothetical protein
VGTNLPLDLADLILTDNALRHCGHELLLIGKQRGKPDLLALKLRFVV